MLNFFNSKSKTKSGHLRVNNKEEEDDDNSDLTLSDLEDDSKSYSEEDITKEYEDDKSFRKIVSVYTNYIKYIYFHPKLKWMDFSNPKIKLYRLI